jgi:hypothetical protein
MDSLLIKFFDNTLVVSKNRLDAVSIPVPLLPGCGLRLERHTRYYSRAMARRKERKPRCVTGRLPALRDFARIVGKLEAIYPDG